jgi:methylated-DNA-[protein]-cysteine S-methyltransferase
VRAELTQYVVPGWGVGELWTSDALVLAHEFRFGLGGELRSGADAHAGEGPDLQPPIGGSGAPSGTLSGNLERVGNGFVATSHLRSADRRVTTPQGRSPHDSTSAPDPRAAAAPAARALTLDVDELVGRLSDYLAGDDVPLDDVPIDLEWATPFQRAVATNLRQVPRGEVVSYGELAALAGYPGAARAAGTFCARNRFMLIVPCHRVVGASGIGGYGSAGIETKRRLLALEGFAV